MDLQSPRLSTIHITEFHGEDLGLPTYLQRVQTCPQRCDVFAMLFSARSVAIVMGFQHSLAMIGGPDQKLPCDCCLHVLVS